MLQREGISLLALLSNAAELFDLSVTYRKPENTINLVKRMVYLGNCVDAVMQFLMTLL